jgi:hypothetical protein
MSILAWNCRGLGNPCIVQELFRLVWEQDLLVLFVVKTGLDTARLEVLRCQLKFSSKLVVSRREHGGGLALFWKQEANLMIKSYSTHHIDTVVNESIEDSWHFTGFYGVSETHRRHVSWSLLQHLHQQTDLPWLCMGDFNELLSMEEKQGGSIRSSRQMQDFRDAIDECGFTWCNNKLELGTIWERLDRGLANILWINKYPEARVHHLHTCSSDHSPIYLILQPEPYQRRPFQKPFRFEEVWLTNSRCRDTVEATWFTQKNGTPMFQVQDKIRNYRQELRKWSKSTFGSITKALKTKIAQLKAAEAASMRGMNHDTVIVLKKEVQNLLS